MKHFAVLELPYRDIAYWDRILNQKHVNYKREGFGENKCLYVKTVKFDDGLLADIKVCSTLKDGEIYAVMSAYNAAGTAVWSSDWRDALSGTWEALTTIDGDEVTYAVKVFAHRDNRYKRLKTTREEFCEIVHDSLVSGISRDYAKELADRIVDNVALDVSMTADETWNGSDVSLGCARTILASFGIDV